MENKYPDTSKYSFVNGWWKCTDGTQIARFQTETKWENINGLPTNISKWGLINNEGNELLPCEYYQNDFELMLKLANKTILPEHELQQLKLKQL